MLDARRYSLLLARRAVARLRHDAATPTLRADTVDHKSELMLDDITPDDFTEKGTFYRMGVPPIAVDILLAIKGVAFNAAWKNRIGVTVDAGTGLTANFISREDLIAAKLAAGRDQDLADVIALRKAAAAEVAAAPKPPAKPRPRKVRKKGPPR